MHQVGIQQPRIRQRGGGDVFRVNMIRIHERQDEERNEPKFGSSRAAPPQGADSGRPSGSSEVRGVGQERRIWDRVAPTTETTIWVIHIYAEPCKNLQKFHILCRNQKSDRYDWAAGRVETHDQNILYRNFKNSLPQSPAIFPKPNFASII